MTPDTSSQVLAGCHACGRVATEREVLCEQCFTAAERRWEQIRETENAVERRRDRLREMERTARFQRRTYLVCGSLGGLLVGLMAAALLLYLLGVARWG